MRYRVFRQEEIGKSEQTGSTGDSMKKTEVSIGSTYVVKVSGKLTHVKVIKESAFGGWDGMNIQTKRWVRIRTAAKLRREVTQLKPSPTRCLDCGGNPICKPGCQAGDPYP